MYIRFLIVEQIINEMSFKKLCKKNLWKKRDCKKCITVLGLVLNLKQFFLIFKKLKAKIVTVF